MPVTRLNSVRNRTEIQNSPYPGGKNRGARGDSLLILASAEALSKKPPLQNRRFKWWECVTWGTACFIVSVLLGLTYLFRKALKKKWMQVHRTLTVCMLVLMVLHIADVGIQLPSRLFDKEAGSANSQDVINDEIKDEINDSVTFSGAQLEDGVYEGSAEGYKSTIKVSVTVNNGAVTDIEILEENDTPDFFERAEAIIDDVIDEQSLEVDTVSGATYSSSGILNAVNNALESAVTDGELEKNDVEIPSDSQKGHGGRHGKNRKNGLER